MSFLSLSVLSIFRCSSNTELVELHLKGIRNSDNILSETSYIQYAIRAKTPAKSYLRSMSRVVFNKNNFSD